MLSLHPHLRYYVYRGHTDMRKSFDGLSGLVLNELKKQPASGEVYIFFNRQRPHIKILFWEGDGYALYYKRLEIGTYEMPKTADNGEVSAQIVSLIMQGIVTDSVRKKKRYRTAA
jgi:transposase